MLQEQDLSKAYRILNIGATALVAAQVGDDLDVMPAAWAGVCDFDKGYVIIDKGHYTRQLIDKSDRFILCYPSAAIAKQVMLMGTISKNDDKQKLEHCEIEFETHSAFSMPLVKGCVAYIELEIIPEPSVNSKYDMIIGKIVKAYTDDRAFRDGHWHLDEVGDELKTIHHVAGGHFYVTGKEIAVPGFDGY